MSLRVLPVPERCSCAKLPLQKGIDRPTCVECVHTLSGGAQRTYSSGGSPKPDLGSLPQRRLLRQRHPHTTPGVLCARDAASTGILVRPPRRWQGTAALQPASLPPCCPTCAASRLIRCCGVAATRCSKRVVGRRQQGRVLDEALCWLPHTARVRYLHRNKAKRILTGSIEAAHGMMPRVMSSPKRRLHVLHTS